MIGFIGICLLVEAAGLVLISARSMVWYTALPKPAFAPNAAIQEGGWTILCCFSGLAAWRVWRRLGPAWPLRLWGWQLAVTALWAPCLFSIHAPWLAAMMLAVAAALAVLTLRWFARVDRIAACLFTPMPVWLLWTATVDASLWFATGGSATSP